MKKKLLELAVFALVMLGLWQLAAYCYSPWSDEDIKVLVDGHRHESEAWQVYHRGDHMIEVNLLAELLGADIRQEGKEYTLTLADNELTLKQGSSGAVLNGESYRLANAVIKRHGQVFVHARTAANAFGWAVVRKGDELGFYTPEYLATHDKL